MTVGKPNFNLNSFGIKYLSKDEVQEFLEKRTQGEEIGSKGDRSQTAVAANTIGQGLKKPTSARPTRNIDPQTGFTSNAPTPPTQTAVATDSTVTDVNTGNKKLKIPSKKLEGGTRSVFTSREKPKKLSNRERHLRADIESSPKTGLDNRGSTVQNGNRKVDESAVIGGQSLQGTKQKLMQKPQPTTKPNEGEISRTKEQVGSIIGDREYSKEGQGKKVNLQSNSRFDSKTGEPVKLTESKTREATGQKNTNSEGNQKKVHRMSATSGKKDSKQETNTAGDAPEGVKSETQTISNSNVEVGVGADAHKKLKEDKNIGRGKGERKDSNLNDQSKTSKNAKAHDTRGKKYKWENDEDKAGYNNIAQVKHSKTGEMVNDRVAQGKYLNSMDKKYKRSVTEQTKVSAAGQKIIDEMSKKKNKANDIIMDMAIMKLDLMKDLNTRDSRSLVPTIPKKEEQKFQEQSTTARFGSKHVGLDYAKTPTTGSSPKGTGTSKQKLDTWQGGQEDSEYRKITNPEYTDDGKGMHDVQSLPKHKRGSPKVDPRMRKKDPIKTIPKTASETIFKAISLKLDLTSLK